MNAKQLKEAFAATPLQSAIVDIPGVGRVMIRELTVGDLDQVDYDSTADARAKNVALSLYTEDGSERVFDPGSQADIEIIKRLGARTLNRLTAALEGKN
ncbi:MAG: hypothetical protein KUL86_10680 [Castellaniella sp.]|nr:hypothetical protein [Castellaniella sp.]